MSRGAVDAIEAARTAAPDPKSIGAESMDLRTSDGWSLRADIYAPPRALGEPVGAIVLAHAMMARRSEFDRPKGAGLARFFAGRGYRVVAFDFRGHGDSEPAPARGGSYSYDDLVLRDMPTACAFARTRVRKGRPVFVLGHSLGGHVAFAAQGSGAIAVDGIVGVGAAVWLRRLEPSLRQWCFKRAVAAAILRITRAVGRFPARALRIGSDDEARRYIEDIAQFVRRGRWCSADGSLDFWASLARIRIPVLQVVSDGDTLECASVCGVRFVEACGGPHDVIQIGRSDDGGPAPSHMGIVTGGRVPHVWDRVETWMRRIAAG
jgi:predicted alpha/beta hydrolase